MGCERLTFGFAELTTPLREQANKELFACMARFGEGFDDIQRAALGHGNDPETIQAAVWTGRRVYAFTAEGGCTSLPLYPCGPLMEVAVVR